jgi:hypothetical protein
MKKYACVIVLAVIALPLKAQSSVNVSWLDATGVSGSVSYSVGQVFFNFYSGTNESIAQGVQQPYEISVITAIKNTEDITLDYLVYPNPTSGSLKLLIKPFENGNWRFRLYDLNSMLLQDKKIVSDETEISLDTLPASVYLLKIINNNREVKVFKIVKR